MDDVKISQSGMLVATGFALIGTVGAFLTTDRSIYSYDLVWLGLFALALLTLSGAVVNFDRKRLIR